MQYGFNFRDVRVRQQQQRIENQKAQKAYANRPRQESSLELFKALYDADEKLMAGNSVDGTTVEPRQFNLESERAAQALLVSLKNSGHEFSGRGIKKFIEYLQHHHIGQTILDTRRADVLAEAFNRASQIGLFTDGDFVTGVPAKSTTPLVGRAREDADRAEYRRELRAELGDTEYERRYGRNGQHPLGARHPNDPV